MTVPHLGTLAALVSFYSQSANGWYVPSLMTYAVRVGIAVVLLLPITILMGGTLTLLIRHLVRQDVSIAPARIAALYAANTVGAALGCFLTDFALIPARWTSADADGRRRAQCGRRWRRTGACVSLYLCARSADERLAISRRYASISLLATGAAVAVCVILPGDFVINFVISRALGSAGEAKHILVPREGLTEVVTIVESRDGRLLLTNGHAMSSTARLSQRYMRALAHIPLLMMDDPASVLVIGFGVGNTTHAATLHTSVRRVEIADLSRTILEHASYFENANHDVLREGRVNVFVNDGRQHLQIQNPDTYDLITLEPPPISYAGVAALYSKEFYELARSRLTARGYVTQWLPTYQVPTQTALSMIRAFIDIFPQSVLLAGAQADLLLIGTAGPTVELDPDRLASELMTRPAARDDLVRLDLGSVREIAGAFVGSARTLTEATNGVRPVTDDWPLTEYSVLSALNPGEDVPANVVSLDRLREWCPTCFSNGRPVPVVAGLDLYMRIMQLAYEASPAEGARLTEFANAAAPDRRLVAGSAYLGAIVPESADLYSAIGVASASRGAMSDAVIAFRKAVDIDPNSAPSHWHLAIGHLQRSIALDPNNQYARADLAALTAGRIR